MTEENLNIPAPTTSRFNGWLEHWKRVVMLVGLKGEKMETNL